jgi:hypothetical protein
MAHPVIAQSRNNEDAWEHTLDTYGDVEIRTDQVKWVLNVDGRGHLEIRAVNAPMGPSKRIVVVPEITNVVILEPRNL